MKIKALLFLMYSFCIVINATAQSSDEEPYVTKTFSRSALQALTVETSGGSIGVAGANQDGFKVEMFVRPNNWNGKLKLSKEDIENRLDDYDIFIGTEGDRVIATAKRRSGVKWDNQRSVSISFKVSAPRKTTSNLKTSGGSITIASLNGDQNFATSGGSLHLEDLEGSITGRTSGGSIDVDNCCKNIDLSTSGGSIKASNLFGIIQLKTSGGSINLSKLDGEIMAHTSGGSVKGDDVKGSLDAGTSGGSVKLVNVSGSLKASTSAGSVDVTMTQLGKYLDLKTSAGSIHVTMPMTDGMDLNLRGNRVSIPLKNFDGNVEKDRVNGKMNGGGIPVTLSANGGSVYVSQ